MATAKGIDLRTGLSLVMRIGLILVMGIGLSPARAEDAVPG